MLNRHLRALYAHVHARDHRNKAGFTLIEALITVSLLALFTALMMPSLQRVNPTLSLEQRASALR